MTSPQDLVESHVASNRIAIFSKRTCPYCVRVKQLFDNLGQKYAVIELNELPNGSEVQDAMAAKAGKRSVPQVFINGTHVGGCDDTMAAEKDGRLAKLLA